MSETTPVSPLLDGYSLGKPMSHHDGVTCIPAMKENSDDKYIIKVISIPASQVQLDALLLAGAYKDAASAMDYFKELSDGVIKEAECLKKLSKLEGYLPFESWQVVPMEKSKLGYQVYLVGTFKRSLEKFMRRNNMTHLAAVNLGLDMCAALSVARQAGWIYADLKPSNIFISEEREYRIGDLGFMAMESLKYSALPSKYRSPYTAPELTDPLATPNDTIDTYAAGLILYQIFNDGVLPKVANPTEEPLPPPSNADYEIAEIILKACAPDPKDRWHDPVEMGQALVAYMQRNTVNDDPILPPQASVFQPLSDVAAPKPHHDDTIPKPEDAEEIPAENLSEETSAMLEKADDLISHQMPDLTVHVAEPSQEEDAPSGDSAEESAPSDDAPEKEEEITPVLDETDTLTDLSKKQRRKRLLIALLIVLLLGAAAAGVWYYRNFYLQTIDQLQVDGAGSEMTVVLDTEVDNSLLSVVCTDTYGNTMRQNVQDGTAHFTGLLPDMLYKIRVEIDGFHKLDGSTTHEFTTPTQTNIIGLSAVTGPEDGSAILSFTIDGPDSEEWVITYSAEGEEEKQVLFSGHTTTISGLTVEKEYTFRLSTTVEQTLMGEDTVTFTASKIVFAQDLKVVAANESSLTVAWSAPADSTVANWNVHCYSASGYDKLITTSDLTATFDDIDTSAAHTIEVTAEGMTQPVRTNLSADPINISSVNVNADTAEKLIVNWEYAGSAPIGGWLLMYTIDGSSRQEVVQCDTNSAVIEVRIPGATYDLSIEAADGRSVFSNTYSYACPNAAVYQNKGYGIYSNHIEGMMDVHLLATPENKDWSYKNVTKADYTTSFAPGQNISLLLYLKVNFYVPRDNTSVLYVIRDGDGKVVSELTAKENHVWYDMWWNTNYHYCELNVPNAPTMPGSYNLSVYFNGMAVTSVNFTVSE